MAATRKSRAKKDKEVTPAETDVVMDNAAYLEEVEAMEAGDTMGDTPPTDDFAPTEAELAALANETAAAEAEARSDEAATDAAVARADKPEKESPKPLRWYRVAVKQGPEATAVVTHGSFATPEAALEATDEDSPFDGMATHANTVVAIQAKNEAAAINYYEALAGDLPESRTLAAATKATRSKEIKPPTGGDRLTTWVPAESEDGRYYLSKSGILHRSKGCRFVKDTTPVLTDDTKTAITRVLQAREDSSIALPKSDDGKITAQWTCAACSGSKVQVTVEAAPEAADAEEVPDDAPVVEADEEIEAVAVSDDAAEIIDAETVDA